MSENQPYIGAPVTLISSLDVRYEGTLFTIDPNESTVALQNVRCLGTENRQSGSKSIPASETVYEFIIFRGENIKSINIAEEKFSKQNELNDPSILKLGPKGTTEPKRKDNRFYDHQYRRDPAKYRQHRQDYDRGYRRDNRRPYQSRGYNQYDRRNNDRRGRNRRNQNNRGRRQENQRQQGPRHNPGDAKFLTGRDENQEQITITEEFDFEKATFDKKDVLADDKKAEAPAEDDKKEESSAEKTEEKDASKEPSEKADDKAEAAENQQEDKKEESPEPTEPAPKPFEYKYDPEKSFFDDLDLVDRSNMDFKARRKIDAQTFGEEASTYKVRRRRRRGGNNRRRRPQQRYRY